MAAHLQNSAVVLALLLFWPLLPAAVRVIEEHDVEIGKVNAVGMEENSDELLFRVDLGPASLRPLTESFRIKTWLENNSAEVDPEEDFVINFSVLYGRNSESWSLGSGSNTSGRIYRPSSTTTTLCVGRVEEHRHLTSLIITAQRAQMTTSSSPPVPFSLLVERVDIRLPFDRSVDRIVSPNHPVTFLVEHSSRPDASVRDRFVLTVDSLTGEDVCMVVAVYNRECPLKDDLGSVWSAQMWATALMTATMTVRTDKFRFLEPFYVSVVVLPDDHRCHLSGADVIPGTVTRAGPLLPSSWSGGASSTDRKKPEQSASIGSKFSEDYFYDEDRIIKTSHIDNERAKLIRIKIAVSPQYRRYLTPIMLLIISSIIFIVIGFAVMLAKDYGRYETEDIGVEGGPGYRPSYPVLAVDNEGQLEMGTALQPVGGNGVTEIGSSEECARNKRPFQPTDEVEGLGEEYDELDGPDNLQIDGGFGLRCACRAAIQDQAFRRKDRIRKGLMRLRENATLADMTRILSGDTWFRRNRSRVYLYLMPLLSLYYFVPAIQVAILAKQTEESTGSQDVCFHNFRCAKPFNIFSDFNHVVSNSPYWMFGVAFCCLVWVKSRRLPETNNPRNDHTREAPGIPQQLSIFYAMGIALVAQGFFSICYHVCPTNLSLQFDTTMMYVICILCYVKIYQFRHPDATANAYSTFGLLGVLILIEALALYWTSWLIFAIFLAFYIVATVFISFDCYYIGIGRLDSKIAILLAKDILFNWKALPTNKMSLSGEGDASGGGDGSKFKRRIRYPRRFLFSALFCAINLTYAIYIAYSKWRDPSKTVTHVVLVILSGNMMLYLGHYIFRKKFENSCRKCSCCGAGTRGKGEDCDGAQNNQGQDDDSSGCCSCCTGCFRCTVATVDNTVRLCGRKVPIFISAGTFFSISAFILGSIAAVFYLDRSANRNMSPAESRNLNEDCTLLDFYDNHDLWHFFGSAAIFMAFLALLTVDDDLLNVPRDKIAVF